MVYRDGEGRCGIPGEALPEGGTDALVERAGAAPTLSEAEAIDRLNVSGEQFLFYLDPDSGRGRVRYLR